jgi:hypothetical protein
MPADTKWLLPTTMKTMKISRTTPSLSAQNQTLLDRLSTTIRLSSTVLFVYATGGLEAANIISTKHSPFNLGFTRLGLRIHGSFEELFRMDRQSFDLLVYEIKDNPIFLNNLPSAEQIPVRYQLAVFLYRLGLKG